MSAPLVAPVVLLLYEWGKDRMWLQQTKHIHGHLWHRYSVTVNRWRAYILFYFIIIITFVHIYGSDSWLYLFCFTSDTIYFDIEAIFSQWRLGIFNILFSRLYSVIDFLWQRSITFLLNGDLPFEWIVWMLKMYWMFKKKRNWMSEFVDWTQGKL